MELSGYMSEDSDSNSPPALGRASTTTFDPARGPRFAPMMVNPRLGTQTGFTAPQTSSTAVDGYSSFRTPTFSMAPPPPQNTPPNMPNTSFRGGHSIQASATQNGSMLIDLSPSTEFSTPLSSSTTPYAPPPTLGSFHRPTAPQNTHRNTPINPNPPRSAELFTSLGSTPNTNPPTSSLPLPPFMPPSSSLSTTSNMRIPTGPSSPLTPHDLHNQILTRRKNKTYFSITTPSAEFTPLSPLLKSKQMETRPCFPTGSRIHSLQCGHLIAVPRDAEPCAPNCATMGGPHLSSAERDALWNLWEKQHAYMKEAEKLASTVINRYTGKPLSVGLRILEAQQHRPDLDGGEFACGKCGGGEARRRTNPAYIFKAMFVIIPVRDNVDRMVVAELEKGVVPVEWRPQPTGRAGMRGPVGGPGGGIRGSWRGRAVANGAGHVGGRANHGVEGGIGVQNTERLDRMRASRTARGRGGRGGRGWRMGYRMGVLEGRIERQRREEKEAVTSRLRDEAMAEEMEDLLLEF
ncbi:hypothetical protein P154DRAFT_530767 [Amniculicola lignicola CBS 123094]|uniref:Uncharacterized protein n=1 Tax=Amniculicola lignicola CBS 123094 TaxID=1392246 RepID=A0A6A5WTD2_9PLEO|nr:hypothetical protein P154DRAFT_530767 [Amniculicola lignicola CBS 123094]